MIRIASILWGMGLWGAALLACPDAVADPSALEAGFGEADITPLVGWRMSGYFNERLSTGVRDPLKAKAVALRQGEVRAALVFCDLIGISREVSSRARERAQGKTGIPAANIAIAATHSHTGPLYFDALREHFHARAVAREGKDPRETVDYAALLVERIVEAVVMADAAARAVRVEASSFRQAPQLSFNRRFHMKDGKVVFNPGQKNPDIVRAAGPVDPEVGALFFREPGSGRPLGSLTVFALHLDTLGGTEYSADYPHHLESGLRKKLGAEYVSLFGAGTCGDLNHIDVTAEGRRSSGEIGALLARTVELAMEAARPIEAPALLVRGARPEVPLQRPGPEDVARARVDMEKVGTRDLSFLDQVKAYKLLDLGLLGTSRELEVQVFRLGREAAIVTLPGEVFVELGLEIKRASPFPITLVIELSNDDPAYIPTRKAFEEGSYETVNSRIEAGGGERMVEAARKLLAELAN